MTDAADHAAQAARLVVENGAVYTRTGGDPFFFSSGWASPIFIDVKRLISLPAVRDELVRMALERLRERLHAEPVDFVAGCELAGVPFAAIIADRLKRPLVIVRKQGKGFGRLAQFEGTFDPDTRALLIDDLSTDGITKSTFRTALERAEAKVVETFVFLDYRVFQTARPLMSLMTLDDIITAAELLGRLSGRELAEVKAFAADAPAWSRRNGGISALPR
jgi:orotate phosphoribosyltransferase